MTYGFTVFKIIIIIIIITSRMQASGERRRVLHNYAAADL